MKVDFAMLLRARERRDPYKTAAPAHNSKRRFWGPVSQVARMAIETQFWELSRQPADRHYVVAWTAARDPYTTRAGGQDDMS